MIGAKHVAKSIAKEVIDNGNDKLSQTLNKANEISNKVTNSNISGADIWQQVKNLPASIKHQAHQTVAYTIDVTNSVKDLGHSINKLNQAVSKLPATIDGVNDFVESTTKNVDNFQEKSQPELDKIEKTLNR